MYQFYFLSGNHEKKSYLNFPFLERFVENTRDNILSSGVRQGPTSCIITISGDVDALDWILKENVPWFGVMHGVVRPISNRPPGR